MVGYERKVLRIGNRQVVEIKMDQSSSDMSEVVVIGYGTQKRADVTGSISSVSAAEIRAVPVISAGQALQGRAPGVDVIASGYAPGSGVTIRIRGVHSINASNDPLFVVDGIPISGGINDINPSIIESMDVLKDASATAIYGARGSNGVILITTKKGGSGRTSVNFDSYVGVSTIARRINSLDKEGWVAYKSASLRTTQLDKLLDPIELANYNQGEEVNWMDFNLRKGWQQSHSVGVSGGNEKTKFYVNANFIKQDGIVKNSDFTRGSVQVNLDHRINDKFRIGTSTLLSTSKENIVNLGQVLGTAMLISPLGEVYNPDGTYRLFPTTEALSGNPMTDLENEKNQRVRTRIFSSIYGEYEFFKGLKYRMNFGPDLSFEDRGRFIGSYTNTLQGAANRATSAKADTKAYLLENIVTYNKKLAEHHNLDVTLMHSIQKQSFSESTIEAQGMPSERMLWHDMSAGTIRSFDSDQQEWSILSYMARINYSYKNKYLLTLTARRDGSSRFGEDRKIGYFPSAAIGWKIIEEDFMKDLTVFSDLKLRASYGSIGNTALNPYQSMGGLSRRPYLFGSTAALGFEPNSLPNPELHWETSTQLNIALDFSLLNDRISGTFEHYQIRTTDLLLNRALAPSTGFGSILTNIGSTKNTGFDLSIRTVNTGPGSQFKWTTNFNVGINKNQILDLYGTGKDDIGNNWFIGEPINVHFDLVFDGIWQESEKTAAAVYGRTPGQIKVKDLNNDKLINADDRQILGSPIPKWSGGITNNFGYKGFDLSVFVNTRQGFMINSAMYGLNNLEGRYNIPDFINYYTPDKPSNDFPRPVSAGANNPNLSVLRYRDASFVRVRNITLSYNFKDKAVQSVGIRSLRIYATAHNPFTFTKFKGWDPENASNIESYPAIKMVLVGVNASF
jgi:TonB-linked SusC/RagA family outer membrane protein